MMADLISRAAAIEWFFRSYSNEESYSNLDVERALNAIPAVDAAPVVHGSWIKMIGMMPPEYHGHYECSECGWHMKGLRNSWTREEEFPYCPNCGAKMDGERRDEDAAD